MRASLFAFVLLLAPLAIPGGAAAQPAPGARPLDRLLPEIRRAYPGRFLDAEGVTTNGSPHYHLKWLTPDGRIMWLDADARTGRVVQEAPGRDTFDRPVAPSVPRYGDNGPQGSYGRAPYQPQYPQAGRPYASPQSHGAGPRFGNAPPGGGPGGGRSSDRGYGGQSSGRNGRR